MSNKPVPSLETISFQPSVVSSQSFLFLGKDKLFDDVYRELRMSDLRTTFVYLDAKVAYAFIFS